MALEADYAEAWNNLGNALADIGADPLRWIALLGRKWMLLWNARELEDTDDFYIYRQHSRLQAILAPFSPFGLLAALAAAGALRQRNLSPFGPATPTMRSASR